jgi:hypothetical protein
MPARETLPSSDFALRFPGRFSEALSDARGAIAGVARSAAGNGRGGLIDPESLRRLHEIFRLRIELELEVAAVLWHTAEIVCAITDATEVLNRRRAADADAGAWLTGISADEVGSRPARLALRAQQARGPTRWPDTDVPAALEAIPGWGAPEHGRHAEAA